MSLLAASGRVPFGTKLLVLGGWLLIAFWAQSHPVMRRVFAALAGIEYDGPIHVELSRHSHDAVETAGNAMAFLAKLLDAL